ncbi:MAG: diaminopimelate epimerase [Elusimicrobia bacterium]|nr:diaminopimelate epimerase [Elusimicrobiota bacterium]
MKTIPFVKAQASGNDFIVLKDRLDLMRKSTVKKLCDRKFGIGADGVLFVFPTDVADFRFAILNSDGSHPKMCGNGARCAAVWAAKYLKPGKKNLKIETDAGMISARVFKNSSRVEIPRPKRFRENFAITAAGKVFKANFAVAGVPHAVLFLDNIQNIDVGKFGRLIRFHREFAPAGANVDFAKILSRTSIKIRTYERGVEGETLSCGTGATAAAYIANRIGLTGNIVKVDTRSGETLTVEISEERTFLTGPAQIVFEGKVRGLIR